MKDNNRDAQDLLQIFEDKFGMHFDFDSLPGWYDPDYDLTINYFRHRFTPYQEELYNMAVFEYTKKKEQWLLNHKD